MRALKDSEKSRFQLMMELKQLRKAHERGRRQGPALPGPDRLAALHAAMAALDTIQEAELALREVLRAICRVEGWEAGLYWQELAPQGELRLVATWCDPGIAFEAIASLGRQTSFKPGFGPLGRAWTAADAGDVVDLGAEVRSPRAPFFMQEGLRWATYHPVRVDGRIAGAFELVGIEPPEPDPGRRMLLELVAGLVASRFKDPWPALPAVL